MKIKIIIGLIGIFLFTLTTEARNVNKFSHTTKFPMYANKSYFRTQDRVDFDFSIKVRYRHWAFTKSWSSGYGQIIVTQNGKRYKMKKLGMRQYQIIAHHRYNPSSRKMETWFLSGQYSAFNKYAEKHNTSYLKLDLQNPQGPVAVSFHLEGWNNRAYSMIRENWWDSQGSQTPKSLLGYGQFTHRF